jgi:hypothetical protein
MEPIHLSSREAILYVALINAAVGFVLGLIPFGFGFFRDRKALGILAIAISTIGGAILGVFVYIPAVIIFTWLILRNPRREYGSGSEVSGAAADDLADR